MPRVGSRCPNGRSSDPDRHVQPGDWLALLARRFYGDAGRWLLIWRANSDLSRAQT